MSTFSFSVDRLSQGHAVFVAENKSHGRLKKTVGTFRSTKKATEISITSKYVMLNFQCITKWLKYSYKI